MAVANGGAPSYIHRPRELARRRPALRHPGPVPSIWQHSMAAAARGGRGKGAGGGGSQPWSGLGEHHGPTGGSATHSGGGGGTCERIWFSNKLTRPSESEHPSVYLSRLACIGVRVAIFASLSRALLSVSVSVTYTPARARELVTVRHKLLRARPTGGLRGRRPALRPARRDPA
jgi:hypothetical protein